MAAVQLPGSHMFDTPIEMHTSTQTADVSLSQNFQDRLSDASRKHGILECGEQKKWSSKNKWTNREYHVPNNEDVEHQDVKIYCATNQLFHIIILWSTQQTT